MVPIKIECACRQRYAFDVEPVEGRMPHPVDCPSCGADGTAAANHIIAQSLAPQPTAVPIAPPGIRLRTAPVAAGSHAAPSARSISNLPQMDPKQVEHEARAKIFWGDSPESVTKYLMMQGVGYQEASELVASLSRERAAATRGNGVRKIVTGVPLMFVPVVAFFIFRNAGIFPVKLFAFTVMIGLYGGYLALTGTMMIVSPSVESGDVADQ